MREANGSRNENPLSHPADHRGAALLRVGLGNPGPAFHRRPRPRHGLVVVQPGAGVPRHAVGVGLGVAGAKGPYGGNPALAHLAAASLGAAIRRLDPAELAQPVDVLQLGRHVVPARLVLARRGALARAWALDVGVLTQHRKQPRPFRPRTATGCSVYAHWQWWRRRSSASSWGCIFLRTCTSAPRPGNRYRSVTKSTMSAAFPAPFATWTPAARPSPASPPS